MRLLAAGKKPANTSSLGSSWGWVVLKKSLRLGWSRLRTTIWAALVIVGCIGTTYFAQLCDLSRPYGIYPHLEFMP